MSLIAIAAVWPHVSLADREPYRVDPSASHVTIAVGKAGAFSFVAGHTHEVTGPFESGAADVDLESPAQSHLHLVIAAADLKVSGPREPAADRPKVQAAMDSDKVLDIARYPRIIFDSTAVTVTRRDAAALDVVVAGRLTIRDVTRPLTVPVHVDMSEGALTATGRFSIRQSAFGITPITVAGLVTVKDALEISFSIAARRAPAR